MFDLQKDPQEMRSVYGRPEYTATQKDLHTELQRLRTELKVPLQDPLPPKKKQQPETKRIE